jgi:hypothetical protein
MWAELASQRDRHPLRFFFQDCQSLEESLISGIEGVGAHHWLASSAFGDSGVLDAQKDADWIRGFFKYCLTDRLLFGLRTAKDSLPPLPIQAVQSEFAGVDPKLQRLHDKVADWTHLVSKFHDSLFASRTNQEFMGGVHAGVAQTGGDSDRDSFLKLIHGATLGYQQQHAGSVQTALCLAAFGLRALHMVRQLLVLLELSPPP